MTISTAWIIPKTKQQTPEIDYFLLQNDYESKTCIKPTWGKSFLSSVTKNLTLYCNQKFTS